MMPGVVEVVEERTVSHLLTQSSKVFSVDLLNDQKDTSANQLLFSALYTLTAK